MNRYTIDNIKDFNLEHIFECGQCFRWEKQEDGSYTGVAKGRIVNMRYVPDAANAGVRQSSSSDHDGASQGSPSGKLTITPCTKEEFEEIWRPYLDLDRDYAKIKETLSDGDPVMKKAAEYGYGIRILKQDLWETIVSFIISQNNNIPRIKGCIERLCENFGDPIESPDSAIGKADSDSGKVDRSKADACSGTGNAGSSKSDADSGKAGNDKEDAGNGTGKAGSSKADADSCPGLGDVRFDIPSPERLAGLTEEDLAPVRLGYRAKYIIETAKAVCEKGLPKDFEELSALCGVGPKVASCISLFGMQDYSSFPIDVWVMKVMHELYGLPEKNKKEMAEFAREKFGELGGFAQQYLFYYMRDRN